MTIINHPTNENLRIRTSLDDGPPQPYNDGGFPIWRMVPRQYHSGYSAEQETGITSYVTPGALDDALSRLNDEHDLDSDFALRYLRIFWGVTFATAWHSGSYWYFTCDPADWREKVGVPDFTTRTLEYADKPFAEWQAWCEGNVHIAWPQQRIFVRSHHQAWDLNHGDHPDACEATSEDTTETYEWVDTDDGPVGGYYGDVDQDMAAAMAWQFGWDIPDGHRFEMED
jgi:hypothetical protein